MTNFVEQLGLVERAKEDIYFARIDRELIDALHQHERLKRPLPAGSNQRITQLETATESMAMTDGVDKKAEQ